MSNITGWIKSNPLVVICALVVLLGLGAIFYFWQVAEGAFQQGVSGRSSQLSQIRQAKSVVDGVPVTEAHIAKRKKANNEVRQANITLFTRPVELNEANHTPFMQGIFPFSPDSKYFGAKQEYIDEFTEMYNALNAGMPPTAQEVVNDPGYIEQMLLINRTKTQIEQLRLGGEFQINNLREKLKELQAQYDELEKTVVKIQGDRARSISVYATKPQLSTQVNDPNWKTGIFTVGNWPTIATRPSNYMEVLWEAQMEVWIQKDIVKSIRIANGIEANPTSPPSVIDAPIKKIESINVAADYVGAGGGNPNLEIGFDYSAAGQAGTGRVSNAFFDVRLVEVKLIVDGSRVSAILNAFGQVNFQTPVVRTITNVPDEMIRNTGTGGWFFGNDTDLVELDMVVETLWLRRFTAGHPNVAAARKEFEARVMDPDAYDRLPSNLKRLADQYKDLDSDEKKNQFVKTNWFDTGYMPNAVRMQRGIPLLEQ